SRRGLLASFARLPSVLEWSPRRSKAQSVPPGAIATQPGTKAVFNAPPPPYDDKHTYHIKDRLPGTSLFFGPVYFARVSAICRNQLLSLTLSPSIISLPSHSIARSLAVEWRLGVDTASSYLIPRPLAILTSHYPCVCLEIPDTPAHPHGQHPRRSRQAVPLRVAPRESDWSAERTSPSSTTLE
ncbi:hypothetical protein PRIPAC_77392, partial [Pristionchus pacificus]|uniref:Uncharacterized protein n=1 Tax=Pristionchus pacificus TaxID=54126 RepID=A0A2A6BWV9_PRIPA